MNKLKKMIISLLSAFIIFSEILIKNIYIKYGTINIKWKTITKFCYSNTSFFLVSIIVIALYIFYSKTNIKKKKGYNILALIFSLFLTFGYTYDIAGDMSLIFGNMAVFSISVIKVICYYVFLSTCLNILGEKIKSIDLKKIKLSKILTKFKNYYEAHPYKTTILILLIAWLPYIISFYPGIVSPDPSNQIIQYYNKPTSYSKCVNLLNDNVLITNHHPVFHTFILGGFASIGESLININFGIFLFSLFQIILLLSALTYILVYLKKENVSFIYRFIILLFFALTPVFPLYAMSPVKDTFFGILLVFYIIEMHKLITKKEYHLINYIVLAILILLMMLVRNNGIFMVLFSLPLLLFFLKDQRIQISLVIIMSLGAYGLHNKVLLPKMYITPGSIREVLSVPFQQTARYTKYYSNEQTEEEKEIIDRILGYDDLAKRYDPDLSDKVKNEFKKTATKEDLKDYFKVWFKGLLKHPATYINATANNMYGYFYPNTTNWYVYYRYFDQLEKAGFDYHYNNLNITRNVLSTYAVSYAYIPFIGATVNIGFISWTYLFLLVYLVIEKNKKLIPLLLPALTLLLTVIVGPVNTYFRYIFPIFLTLPLIIGLIMKERQKN